MTLVLFMGAGSATADHNGGSGEDTPLTVWRQLNAVTQAPGGGWPLVCVEEPGINAYVDHDHRDVAIHAATAALTDNEIAAILAHERAHLALRHPAPHGAPRRADREAEADRLGVFYMRLAGYDPRGAIDLLKRFKTTRAVRVRRRRLEQDVTTAMTWIPENLDAQAARRLGVLLRHRLLQE